LRNLIRYKGEHINTSSAHPGGGKKKDVISRIKQLRKINKKIYDQDTRDIAWGNSEELIRKGFKLDQLLLDCRVSNTRKDADSSVKQKGMKWITRSSEGRLNKKQREVAKDDQNFIFIEHSSVDSDLSGVNRGDESKSSRVRSEAKQPGHDRLLELAQMYSTNAVLAKSGLGVGKDGFRYSQNADLLRNDLAFNTLYDIYANPEGKTGLEIEHVSSRITPVISIMLAQRMYIPVNQGCKSGKDRARMTQCMLNAANRILERIISVNKIKVNEVHSSGETAKQNQEKITTKFVEAMNSREFAYEFLIEFLDPVDRKIANSNCPGAYGIKRAKVPKTIRDLLPLACQEVVKAYIEFDNAFAKYNKIDEIKAGLKDMGGNHYKAEATQPVVLQKVAVCQKELIKRLEGAKTFLENPENSSNVPQSDAISRLIKSIEREMKTHGPSPGAGNPLKVSLT
jgi:hypothetical protein